MSEASKKKTTNKSKTKKTKASASTKPVQDGDAIKTTQAEQKQTKSEVAALTGHYQVPIAPTSGSVVEKGNGKDGDLETGNEVETQLVSNSESNNELFGLLDRKTDIEVLGAMEVSSRSDNGFWRSGVHFSRLEKTVVIVVSDDDIKNPELSQSGLGIESAFPVVFMAPSQAKRVHDEPHLNVDVLELESLIGE
ncbi:hypothetical protein AAFX60_019090 [Aliivibrio fischeri]